VAADPRRVYFAIAVLGSTASTLAFSIATLFRLQRAGLDPLQLLLVGTCMEAAVFVCEIPTGVIADAVSRRLSVIIGHVGMGAAFLVEAAHPSFGFSLAGQVLWGAMYTFTSGATVAWLTGELGEPDEAALSSLFLRASRWGSIASIVAIPVCFAVGAWSLRAPILMAGGLQLVLGLGLVIVMPERAFERTQSGQRASWATFAATARAGVGGLRTSSVLLGLTATVAITGAASEAYDRFSQAHLLDNVGFPTTWSLRPVWWIAGLTFASALAGVFVPAIVQRHHPGRDRQRLGKWVSVLYVIQLLALLAFCFAPSFAVAAALILVIERVRSVRFSLFWSFVVPLTPRRERATVLSTMSQADAVGQVVIGPLFGIVARSVSIPASLLLSALMMLPGLGVLRAAMRRAREQPMTDSLPPVVTAQPVTPD
jgi:MFS transporter, DHA3 family, tetracycline resistance protein